MGSGEVGGARCWVAGRAGLQGVPPTWLWVVGFSLQILKHPTTICDTGVNVLFCFYHLQHLVFTFQKELLSNLPKAGQEGKIFLSLQVN